jgi:hypothetical protein
MSFLKKEEGFLQTNKMQIYGHKMFFCIYDRRYSLLSFGRPQLGQSLVFKKLTQAGLDSLQLKRGQN